MTINDVRVHPTAGFDLSLSDAQLGIQERLHRLALDQLRPGAALAERDGADVAPLVEALESLGVGPRSILGSEAPDLLTVLLAVEELAYGDPGLAWATASGLQAAVLVSGCGDERQREELRAQVADPSAAVSVLLYEDFGRAPSEYTTVATAVERGWRIEGRKASVSNPTAPAVSVVVARDRTDGRLVSFCYEGSRSGIEAVRDDRRSGKLAITAAPTGPVVLGALELGDAHRLVGGQLEQYRAVSACRLLLAAALIGCARASVEFAAAYAMERKTWGNPIASYQAVSFPLAGHLMEITELRLRLWDVAARLDHEVDPACIETLTSRTVSRASAVALESVRDGVQLVGVRGITRDLPCEFWYRSAGVLAAIDVDPLHIPYGRG